MKDDKGIMLDEVSLSFKIKFTYFVQKLRIVTYFQKDKMIDGPCTRLSSRRKIDRIDRAGP